MDLQKHTPYPQYEIKYLIKFKFKSIINLLILKYKY